jgi:hypothetical protein
MRPVKAATSLLACRAMWSFFRIIVADTRAKIYIGITNYLSNLAGIFHNSNRL